MYFDKGIILPKIHYMLKPGGHMEKYQLSKPSWCGNLFEPANMLTYDLPVTFTRESWHGRMKACRGIGASSLSIEEIAAWEKEHMEYMQTVPEKFDILHYITILDLRKLELETIITYGAGSNKFPHHDGLLNWYLSICAPVHDGLYFKIISSLVLAISLSPGSQAIKSMQKCPPGFNM